MKYKIFQGFDHSTQKPLFQVVGVDNDYSGEWHATEQGAQDELNGLIVPLSWVVVFKVAVRDTVSDCLVTAERGSFQSAVADLAKNIGLEGLDFSWLLGVCRGLAVTIARQGECRACVSVRRDMWAQPLEVSLEVV